MPLHILREHSDLQSKVPPYFQIASIPSITPHTDCTHRNVQGRVAHKGPVVSSSDNDYILKAVIQEEDLQQSCAPAEASISVILFGSLAKDFSQSVSQGDVVLITGFTVSKSPTAELDRLHPCHLVLKGPDACVYVCPSACPPSRRIPAVSSSSEPKYTYIPLNELKPRMVVNVYGVVTFFKQPFPTKGTDYCSTLKITDQSNAKICCMIFSEKLEDHPEIFRVGDIIRLHRVKTQLFNSSITLMTSLGWSTVTFDGTVDSPVEPRSSNSKSFHFDEVDKHKVAALRQWAASQSALFSKATIPLSAVQPKMYFDLTCQLLAKARMDSRCILLKVWDGTKCLHPLLNVEPESVEGDTSFLEDKENLVASVLVYDNHTELAGALKPGVFLRFYNLHAVPQASPGLLPDCPNHLGFHLHGGTSYGRGLRELPSDSPDLFPLKRALQAHANLDNNNSVGDDTLLDIWHTPPESVDDIRDEEPDAERREVFQTVRTCEHTLQRVTLARVKRSSPRVHHIRAQIKSYQPQKLYQCLKLFCPKCKTIREVPDDETIAQQFEDALGDSSPCSEHWAVSSSMDAIQQDRTISMHVSSDMVLQNTHSQLVFIQGMTLVEMCVIAQGHKNLVPVRSSQGRMSLLDLSAPFLFCGGRRHYRCRQCSQNNFVEPLVSGVEVWNEQGVANALGVQLMQYVMLLKFELEDETDCLEALLWEDAEKFFHVSATETSHQKDLQDCIKQTMTSFHPPGVSREKRPWLDFCLTAYTVDDTEQGHVCYQILNTETRKVQELMQSAQ